MKLKLTTTKEKNLHLETDQREMEFAEDINGIENEVVNLYPDRKFEEFEGFGGAVTDSSAYVYSLMSQADKQALLTAYFSEKEMNYRLIRVHMDSCDFSTEMYEAMSDKNDRSLKTFSFERTEKYILPMLQDIQKMTGNRVELMLSPWSPPAFMKTNGERRYGGKLKWEYAGLWADYICRYIDEFKKRGFRVQRISLQNEAKAVQTWDSCVYTAGEEKKFLEEFMYPALIKHGFKDIEVFIWDHNKERAFERAEEIVKGKAAEMVSGVACHWYSGDHFENLDLLRRFYPELKLILSESAIEYRKFDPENMSESALCLSHEIIGDLSHGITAFYDWNVLLDEKGGPNHAGNYCLAPFLYDTEKKELQAQTIQKHLWHFSHFIKPGAKRIALSRYTEMLDVTAFVNPDGNVVFVLLNRDEKEKKVVLRLDGQTVEFVIGSREICTGEITA